MDRKELLVWLNNMNDAPANTSIKAYRSVINELIDHLKFKKPCSFYDGYADGNEVWEYFCPMCDNYFEDNEYPYCPECGQAIDWSDNE